MSRRSRSTRDSWDAAPTEGFVAVLRSTLKEPAWRDLSFGARSLFVLLKSFYNGKNNGRIYLAIRKAADELNASKTSVVKWFQELEANGFIRPTQGAFLGADGDAQAAYWRLTEVGYMGEQPTREYRKWASPENKSPYQKMTEPDQKMVQAVPENGPVDPEVYQKMVRNGPVSKPTPYQKLVQSTVPYRSADNAA